MKPEKVHFSVVIVLCDMEMQSASIHLNSRGQGHIETLAKVHSVGINLSTFTQKLQGLVALLTIILALSPNVYDRSGPSCSKHC